MKYESLSDPYHCLSCLFERQCQNNEDYSLFSYDSRNLQESNPKVTRDKTSADSTNTALNDTLLEQTQPNSMHLSLLKCLAVRTDSCETWNCLNAHRWY